MNYYINNQEFKLFSFGAEKDLYAAIPLEYLPTIEGAVKEYGTLENVPADKTVRGCFLKMVGNNEFSLDENTPQIDLTINQLKEPHV